MDLLLLEFILQFLHLFSNGSAKVFLVVEYIVFYISMVYLRLPGATFTVES